MQMKCFIYRIQNSNIIIFQLIKRLRLKLYFFTIDVSDPSPYAILVPENMLCFTKDLGDLYEIAFFVILKLCKYLKLNINLRIRQQNYNDC